MNAPSRDIEILLVEDNPADVQLTIEALKDAKLNNHLSVAEDGVEATAFLRREGKYANAPRPDLILLDLNMPRKNGREVLKDIKSDEDLKTIPVVILTTSEAEQDIVKSYRLNANCYVTKPVDFFQFMKVVKAIEDFWMCIVKLPPRPEWAPSPSTDGALTHNGSEAAPPLAHVHPAMPVLIQELLAPTCIDLSVQGKTDTEVITNVSSLLQGKRGVRNFESLRKDILTRERLSPTAIGSGLAIPHARTDHVDHIVMSVGRLDQPVIFDSQETWLVFVIGIPRSLPGKFLSLIGAFGRLAHDQIILEALKAAATPKEFIAAFAKKTAPRA